MELLVPNNNTVKLFNSFWQNKPSTTRIKIFEDEDIFDIRAYIAEFEGLSNKDQEIQKESELGAFLKNINNTYSTRISEVSKIIEILHENGINTKDSLKDKIANNDILLPEFVKICKVATGKYTYSFATKVFSFLDDQDRYPIIDSFVVTLLDRYEHGEYNKSKWGDYAKFVKSYTEFRKHYELMTCTFKEIDIFLWTYGKILTKYWHDMGVLDFDTVSFDLKTIKD